MSLNNKPLPALSDCRVLITGGAGFIGSALVWGLNRLGCTNIVIADQLGASEKWRHLTPLCFEDYLDGDNLLPRLHRQQLGRFDLVFHMAASSSTTERDLSFLIRNNFELTKDLATWALEQGTRFVYASSAATYGKQAVGVREEESALQHLRPLNAYGFSKWLFDLHAARKGWFTRITGIKYFNIFGPNEDHKADMRSLVCKTWGQVEQTGRLQLFKSHDPRYRDGEQQRDFLYVKDAVAMTVYLATNLQATGLFNVGSGTAHTWLALGQALFRALNREPQFEFIPMPPGLHARYQYVTMANIDKLRGAGYGFPITLLEDAVCDYVTRYLAPGKVLDPGEPDEMGVMERLKQGR